MATKKDILTSLWFELDANMAKAMPIAKEIAALKKSEDFDMGDFEDRTRLAELEVKKYKEAGFAPGLATAIQILCPADFADYKAVVKHAQARMKDPDVATPGLSAPEPEADEAQTELPSQGMKGPAPKRAPRAKLDPGPNRNDPSQTDEKELPASVAEALKRAEAKVAAKRKDDTPEEQEANHREDLPVPESDDASDAAEIRRQLAALEDA